MFNDVGPTMLHSFEQALMPYPSFSRVSSTFEHVKQVLISNIVSMRHKTRLSAGLTCTNNFRSSDTSRVWQRIFVSITVSCLKSSVMHGVCEKHP